MVKRSLATMVFLCTDAEMPIMGGRSGAASGCRCCRWMTIVMVGPRTNIIGVVRARVVLGPRANSANRQACTWQLDEGDAANPKSACYEGLSEMKETE